MIVPVLYLLIMIVIVVDVHFAHQKERAVHGSIERYKAASKEALSAMAVVVFDLALAYMFSLYGYYTIAIALTVVAALHAVIAWNSVHNDDNWFSDQYQGLKNLRKRLTPTLQPAPVRR